MDLNRRNEFFAKREASGRFFRISYSEAYARVRRGEDTYERVLPDHSYTLAEKFAIPITRITTTEE